MNNRELTDQLLKDVPAAQLASHRAYLQRHVKELLTQLSKTAFEDTIPAKKKCYECQLGCYKKRSYESFDANQTSDLARCVTRCKEPLRDLNGFLDNINYMSKRKFDGCSKKCEKEQSVLPQRQFREVCLWECYNRLDKRYLRYWLQQRQKLLARYAEFQAD